MVGTQFNPSQRGNLAKFTVSHKRKCGQRPQTPQSHSPAPRLTCATAHLRCGSPALWLRCTQAAAALVCATCAPERPAHSSVLRADRCECVEPSWAPSGASSVTSPTDPCGNWGALPPGAFGLVPTGSAFGTAVHTGCALLDLGASQPSPLTAPAGESTFSSSSRLSSSELNPWAASALLGPCP